MTFTSTNPSRVRRSALAVAAAALSVTVGLTSCSGSSNGNTGPSTTPTTGKTSSVAKIVSPTIKPTHAQNKIPPDNKIVEVPALRKTIALTGCTAAPGGWSGAGTAKNPGKKTETYHLLVFFTDKYSRTIDFARTAVTVKPGQTKHWKATRKFSPPAGTQCVLRGLYQT